MAALVVMLCSLLAHGYGSSPPVVYDTIVVGMGAAGTSAASTLARAGRKVLALEAQNRIGGRVWTVPFGDGTVELGAEWIHGINSSSTYELAIQNNITILDQEVSMEVYFSDGSTARADIVRDVAKYALELVDEPPEQPEALGHYITRRVRTYITTNHPSVANDTAFIQSVLEFLDPLIITYDSANSWIDVSTHTSFEVLGGSQVMSWHRYGYYTLFELLLNTYKNGPGYPTLEIKLNTEVTQIQWPQDPKDNIVVTVKDGSKYTAKNIIVTVSVGVLKERYKTLFNPPLPSQKIRPIEAITIGVCAKVIFSFTQPWWTANSVSFLVWNPEDKEAVSEEDKWLLRMNTPGTPMSSNNSLTIWSCGDTAKKVETLSEEVVKRKVMGLLRKFMGKRRTIPEPVQMLKSSWYSNPFTRGTYTYDSVNAPDYPSARADLAQPLVDSAGNSRIMFAGEATETKEFATVHGAVDSGRREANRILSVGN